LAIANTRWRIFCWEAMPILMTFIWIWPLSTLNHI